MNINSICDFRKAMRQGNYAWPGGYPLYFVMSDGESLSIKSARENIKEILIALRDNDGRSGWKPAALEINCEDTSLYCSHSNEKIESAYGDD